MVVAAPPHAGADLEFKTISLSRASFKARAGSSSGVLEGYLSTFGTIDAVGDTIIRGAYKDTIPSFISRGSLFFEHDHMQQLGTITSAREDERGLLIEAEFYSDPDSQKIRRQVVERLDRGKHVGLSIGFLPDEVTFRPPRYGEVLPPWVDQVRELRRITLFEASVVAVPANEEAGVLSAKSRGGDTMTVAQRMATRGIQPLPPTILPRSIGERVTASPEFKAMAAGHAREARIELDVSLKALVNGLQSPLDARTDQIEAVEPAPDFLSFLPVLSTDSNMVRVISPTITNNAAATAEATATTGTSGLKPESGVAYTGTLVPTETIPTWVPVTDTVMADAPDFRGVIDVELAQMLRSAVEAEVAAGSGTRPHLRGIANWPGVVSIAVATGGAIGALVQAIGAVRTSSGRSATIIGVEGAAWAALLAAGGLGSPGLVGAPTLYGVPVLPCAGLASGTALVGNGPSAQVYERQEVTVALGYINDQAIRNAFTMLAETRVAAGVTRPSAWKLVTGLPTS